MGTWGVGVFENDAALDFINAEIDRHVSAVEDILADESRFRLDEDAEGELMPRVELLALLCERCGGVLPSKLDIGTWKTRYLEMYDEQIDALEPADDYKQQRRVVIAEAFNRLNLQHPKE